MPTPPPPELPPFDAEAYVEQASRLVGLPIADRVVLNRATEADVDDVLAITMGIAGTGALLPFERGFELFDFGQLVIERGGFLLRLREGTWPGHVMEHVALELQTLAGMKTGFGKARSTSERVKPRSRCT